MKKKLQVFVSSTYEDLKEERMAAVNAILTSGHLPAGMELFSAGDESQKDTIRTWIQESDVYLLILGGRYGSMDTTTGKSYTHWEYEYAGEIGKPRFAVVISDQALEAKVREKGSSVLEKENPILYKEFRKEVLSKLCKIFEDSRDIQIAIFHKMSEYSAREELVGWIHGNEVPNTTDIISENSRLLQENASLKEEILKLREQLLSNKAKQKTIVVPNQDFNGIPFEELKNVLTDIKIKLPNKVEFKDIAGKEYDLYRLFINTKDILATGIVNEYGMTAYANFVYFTVAPKLMMFGLAEKVKVSGKFEKIQISKLGFDFLRLNQLHNRKPGKLKKTPPTEETGIPAKKTRSKKSN